MGLLDALGIEKAVVVGHSAGMPRKPASMRCFLSTHRSTGPGFAKALELLHCVSFIQTGV